MSARPAPTILAAKSPAPSLPGGRDDQDLVIGGGKGLQVPVFQDHP